MVKRYTKIFIIAHGLSEIKFAESIRKNLKIPIEIISKNNGRSSIEITSILDFLNNRHLKDIHSFQAHYEKVLFIKSKLDVQIYILLDRDNNSEHSCKKFLSKELFTKHWAYENIVPVLNSDSFDDVMYKLGYHINLKNKPLSYEKIMTDVFSKSGDALSCLIDFRDKIKRHYPNSNLIDFINYCIKICRENKN